MAKKPVIIVANWKSNPETVAEAEKLAKGISLTPKQKGVTVIVCPPVPFMVPVRKVIGRGMLLGAQDTGMFTVGPHTGDVAISMLRGLKTSYVIVGHSERRAQGDADSVVNKKLLQCLGAGVTPILCVGESVRDQQHQYLNFVAEQLKASLVGVPKSKIPTIVVAYEPIWAIGVNAAREATAEEFREMAIYIRKVLSDQYGEATGKVVKILYGGSVNPKNARAFLENGRADGLLVGHDSLDAKKFGEIIKVAGTL